MNYTLRFTRSVTRHRHRWVVGALAVFAVAAVLSLRLSLRENVRDFQPRASGPADPIEVAIRKLLGGADRVVVLLESDSAMQTAAMAPLLDSLAARLARAPGVHGVQYRLQSRIRSFVETRAPAYVLFAFDTTQLAALGGRLTSDTIRRLVQATETAGTGALGLFGSRAPDPLQLVGPAAGVLLRALGGANLRLADGYLALPGQRGFLFIVEPAPSFSVDSARSLVRAIDSVMAGAPRDPQFAGLMIGKRMTAIGRPVAMVQVLGIAFGDVARVAIASLLASFLLQLWLFRRPLAPLLLAGTVIFAVALTGAVAALVFRSLSLVGWLFISVLVGLGDEFGLYIIAHYWITGAAQVPRADALASALQRPGRGLVYSGLAMAAAFASLALMSYPVMFEVACVTALGLIAMLFSSFTVLPIALAYTEPRRHAATSIWHRSMTVMHDVGQRHPRRWLVGWAALLLGCVLLAGTLQFDPHPWKVALRGSPATAQLERVRQLLGVWPSPIFMVSSGATEAEALERDRAAVYQLERVGPRAGVVTIESLSRWLPAPSQQRTDIAYFRAHAATFSPERVQRAFLAAVAPMKQADPRLTKEYLPRVLSLLHTSPEALTIDGLRRMGLDSMVGLHLVHDGQQVLAVSYVYLAQSPWTAGVTDRFEATMKMGEGDALTRAHFVGDALRGATHQAQLRHDILLATVAAFVMVGLLLLLQFRRVVPALLCLLPLVCGIAAVLGAMALLGIELNVLTMAIAPLMVGLCVDDGIHLVERLERGESRLEVMRDSGAAIIITTLTTVTGFAALVFARFPGIRELGLIGSIGILVALVASLQLVPMCHALLKKASNGAIYQRSFSR
jgi:predicted RND superfamily exporter protein